MLCDLYLLFREEQEKLNVWVAFMNLENSSGTEETLLKVFERALSNCEPYKVFEHLIEIYTRSGKVEVSDCLVLYKRERRGGGGGYLTAS